MKLAGKMCWAVFGMIIGHHFSPFETWQFWVLILLPFVGYTLIEVSNDNP